MQVVIEYLTLRRAYPETAEGVPIPVSMRKLADLFYCTPRNAKLIISKLSKNRWIDFVPGRGRGNLSLLTFRMLTEELLFETATILVKNGDFQRAMELVKEYGEGVSTKGRLISWLSQYFGYRSNLDGLTRFDTLRFPVYRKLNTFDPIFAYFALDAHMVAQIYDNLIRYDPQSERLVPHLALHWESNSDCSKWVFYLRKGIRFHNGTEVTAHEAARSLHRLWVADPNSSQAWLLMQVKSIEAFDHYVLAIELRGPNRLFPQFLSFHAASIVGPESVNLNGVETLPVGSGPFRVMKKTEHYCVLEAVQPHFGGSLFLDRIEILNVADLSDNVDFLKEKRVDVNTEETPQRVGSTWAETDSIHSGSKLITFNQAKAGPLQDIRLREAIHRLLDRRQLVDDLLGNRLFPSTGFQLKGITSLQDNEYDTHHGSKLLQLSSYKGETLRMYVYERHVSDAYWIQQQLAKHGIHLSVQVVEWADLLVHDRMKEADLILYEANLSHPLISLLEVLQSPFSFIRNHMGSELAMEVDQRIEHLLSEPIEEVRQQIMQQAEQLLKETFSISFLVHMKVEASFHPSLQGVRQTPNGWIEFKDLWYKPDTASRIVD